MATGVRAPRTRALISYRHHILVRISHWLTIPLLLGLILSGLSIYWASPVINIIPIRSQVPSTTSLMRESGFVLT